MNYCVKCGKPVDNGMICEDCMINDSPWLSAMKIKESDLEQKIANLKAENAELRARLEKAATFALGMCSEDDCAGDDSVGLPSCDMWHAWDTDENGVNIESGCYLKEYLTELKGE